MALRDVLEFGHKKRDEAPATAHLIDAITALLADGDVAAGTYDTDAVLQAIVLSMREMELLAAQERDQLRAELLVLKTKSRVDGES